MVQPTIPLSPANLTRLYYELGALGGNAEGRRIPWELGKPSAEDLIALAADATRGDPRLLWILVDLLARSYDHFDLLKLRRAALAARWPAALAVAFEFARLARPSQELADVADFVTRRIAPARGEQFFLSVRRFGGGEARRDAEESLAEYKRWGYLAREEPIAKELGGIGRGSLGPSERRNLLKRLVERQGSVTLSDYLTALRGRASRRQATRDLATAPFLVREGTTRGARYRERASAVPATTVERPRHRSRGTRRSRRASA